MARTGRVPACPRPRPPGDGPRRPSDRSTPLRLPRPLRYRSRVANGLIVAVPVTTALAALLATRVEAGELPAEEHAHAH